MKRLLLCLVVVSLLVLPALAEETASVCPPPQPNDPGCVGIDVQGYVDGTASYNAGCVDQFSCEVGFKDSCEVKASAESTTFDCAANVPCFDRAVSNCNTVNNCGVNVTQDKFDASFSVTKINSFFTEKVQANYAVGANDMNSLGGVAICATNSPTLDAAASVSNAHDVYQASQVCLAPGCSASTEYTGNQSLELSANYRK